MQGCLGQTVCLSSRKLEKKIGLLLKGRQSKAASCPEAAETTPEDPHGRVLAHVRFDNFGRGESTSFVLGPSDRLVKMPWVFLLLAWTAVMEPRTSLHRKPACSPGSCFELATSLSMGALCGIQVRSSNVHCILFVLNTESRVGN